MPTKDEIQRVLEEVEYYRSLRELKALRRAAEVERSLSTAAGMVTPMFENWEPRYVDRNAMYDFGPDFTAYGADLARYADPEDMKDGKYAPFWYTHAEYLGLIGLHRYLCKGNEVGATLLGRLTDYAIHKGYTYKAESKRRNLDEQERQKHADERKQKRREKQMLDEKAALRSRFPAGQQEPDKRHENLADEKLVWAVQEVIDKVVKASRWTCIGEGEAFECVHGIGEAFLRIVDLGSGNSRIEVIPPEQIAEPKPNFRRLIEDAEGLEGVSWDFGVVTPINQTHLPVAYFWDPDHVGTNWELLWADEVVHTKINVPARVKRGLSDFYPVTRILKNITPLTNNLTIMAAVQAAIAMVEQYENDMVAPGGGILEGGRTFPTTMVTPRGVESRSLINLSPGTIVKTHGANLQPGPVASNAEALIAVLQMGYRIVGVRWGMPEYMSSGDASNDTRASAETSETPFVRSTERKQHLHGEAYREAIWRCIEIAIKSGKLKEHGIRSREDLEKVLDVKFEPPEVATRDRSAEVERWVTLNKEKIVSKQTIAEKLQLDWELEKSRLAEESQQDYLQSQEMMMGQQQMQAQGHQTEQDRKFQQKQSEADRGFQREQGAVQAVRDREARDAEVRTGESLLGEHEGPGNHPGTGTPQSIHGRKGAGVADRVAGLRARVNDLKLAKQSEKSRFDSAFTARIEALSNLRRVSGSEGAGKIISLSGSDPAGARAAAAELRKTNPELADAIERVLDVDEEIRNFMRDSSTTDNAIAELENQARLLEPIVQGAINDEEWSAKKRAEIDDIVADIDNLLASEDGLIQAINPSRWLPDGYESSADEGMQYYRLDQEIEPADYDRVVSHYASPENENWLQWSYAAQDNLRSEAKEAWKEDRDYSQPDVQERIRRQSKKGWLKELAVMTGRPEEDIDLGDALKANNDFGMRLRDELAGDLIAIVDLEVKRGKAPPAAAEALRTRSNVAGYAGAVFFDLDITSVDPEADQPLANAVLFSHDDALAKSSGEPEKTPRSLSDRMNDVFELGTLKELSDSEKAAVRQYLDQKANEVLRFRIDRQSKDVVDDRDFLSEYQSPGKEAIEARAKDLAERDFLSRDGLDQARYALKNGLIDDKKYPSLSTTARITLPAKEKIDPFGESTLDPTVGKDYKSTQRFANALQAKLTERYMAEVGLDNEEYDDMEGEGDLVETLTSELWESWKTSSTDGDALILQQESASVLGSAGRPDTNERADQYAAKHYGKHAADHRKRVRAHARATYETTQYILAKAGVEEAVVWRAVMLPGAMLETESVKAVPVERKLRGADAKLAAQNNQPTTKTEQYLKLPDITLVRNNLQSTTHASAVANTWQGAGDSFDVKDGKRTVLRIRAGREAFFSLPVFGENAEAENESVLLGSGWRAWDIWLGTAPDERDLDTVLVEEMGRNRLVVDMLEVDSGPHWLSGGQRTAEHLGPGNHPGGSPQTVHGKKGAAKTVRGNVRKKADSVLETIRQNGGITFDPVTAENWGSGFAVSPFKGREKKLGSPDKITEDDLLAYVDENLDVLTEPNAKLGGWVAGDEVYLDVSVVMDDEDRVLEVARDNNQLAYFDLGTFREVWTVEALRRRGLEVPPELEELNRRAKASVGQGSSEATQGVGESWRFSQGTRIGEKYYGRSQEPRPPRQGQEAWTSYAGVAGQRSGEGRRRRQEAGQGSVQEARGAEEAALAEHEGPGNHPGTGTPQSAHAGGKGRKKRWGKNYDEQERLASLSEVKQTAMRRLGAGARGLTQAGVSQVFRDHAFDVIERMTDTAVEKAFSAIKEGPDSIQLVPERRDVFNTLPAQIQMSLIMQGYSPDSIGGYFSRNPGEAIGVLVGDGLKGGHRGLGDPPNPTDALDPFGVISHELGHALDIQSAQMYDGEDVPVKLSQSLDWFKVWGTEIVGGEVVNDPDHGPGIDHAAAPTAAPLSEYARSSPEEGFAEMHRMIVTDRRKAKKLFPKAYGYFKEQGYAP